MESKMEARFLIMYLIIFYSFIFLKLMCIGSLPSSIAESNKKAREEAIDLERRLALEGLL